ncbi:MAG: S8 family peptidase [bacterium]
MRPHLIIQIADGVMPFELPHWSSIIENKSGAATAAHPLLDRVFAQYRLPVWITREYQPHAGAWSNEEIQSRLNRYYRIILQEDAEIPAGLIRDISLLPIIRHVRMGAVGHTDLPELQPAPMSLATGISSRRAIYLEEAQAYTRGDESVVVAVLDTGISQSHPELRGALLPGYDFVDIIDGAGKFIGDFLSYDENPDDEVGHGTHVAGIIAGRGKAMPAGVVPKCKILPVRVLGAMQRGEKRVGAGLIDNINVAVKWAVDQGAGIINMSLGIRHTGGGLPHEEVVDYAKRKGVTIVAASGNDGTEDLYYPGALPHVIAVGAFDVSGEVAGFSTYGKQVSFVAPGTDIYSSYLDHAYAFSSGTSHATPFVTGAVAMLKSYARKKGARLSDAKVKHILKHTADKVDAGFKNRRAGFGRINLLDAVRWLEDKLN